MFSLVITLRETNVATQIQESVEYKEFLIVRHILCAKCTYLLCIDLLLTSTSKGANALQLLRHAYNS